jgi:peptide/nickel transport system substrate-binding protein
LNTTELFSSVPVRAVRRFVGSAILASAALLSSACASPPSAQQPKPHTVLKLGVGFPNAPTVARLANTFVADSLIGSTWNGRPVDRVVSAWEWSDDRLTLKLHLRPGLKWHDNTPVDIGQFKQTLEAAIKVPTAGTVSYASVTSVALDATAKDTVQIRLSRPEAFILADLAGSTMQHPANNQIGTGPFKYAPSTESTIRLSAFEDYYRGRPRLDEVELRNFGEPRGSWAALMRGEIDGVHEIAPNVANLPDPDGQRSYSFIRPYFIQLAFNTRHPALKNPVVRQALSYGVDRQAIIEQGMNRQGTVAEGPIWPYHWAYSTAQKTYTHNTEAATLRLESAGLKIKPGKTGRMPSRLHIRCLAPANNALFEKVAMVLQKQLYEIGVDLEIIPLPGDEVGKRLDAGDFETVLIQRASGRSLSWTYSTFHSSVSASGYSAADSVLDRLRQTTNETEIRAGVSDLQQIFHDDPPAIFIAWPKTARVVSSKIHVPDPEETGRDISKEAGRDVLSSLWLWRPADARK